MAAGVPGFKLRAVDLVDGSKRAAAYYMSNELKTSAEKRPEGELDRPVAAQRDSVRRSLLRANTAVAVLIASTLVLALSALWQSDRATKLQASAQANQRRAETAEESARTELWRSLVTEARAIRSGQSLTRREAALDAVRRAAAILPAPELRNEAIGTLALPEVRVDSVVPLDGSVRAYEFDPDLRQAAIGRTNGDVVIYRLPEAVEWRRLRRDEGPVPAEQGAVVGLSFSPQGDALAVRYNRGALAVWDVASGRMRFVRDADQARRPASRGSFSSDGAVLVAPVFVPDGFAAMDARSGRVIAHFPEFSSYHHCAVRPGATEFAVYATGKVARVDWVLRKTVNEYPFPDGARVMAWSNDGVQLAIAGGSLQVHVWDVARSALTRLSGLQDSVSTLHFDPAGKRVAAVATDNASRFWDLPEGRPVSVVEGRRCLRLGSAGATGWAVPRQQLEVRRPLRSEVFQRWTGVAGEANELSMDISPDGAWVVSKAYPEGLHIWNLEQPGPPEYVGLTNVQSFCFHPTEPRLFLMRNLKLEVRTVAEITVSGRRTLALGEPEALPGVPNRWTDLVTTSADGTTRAYVLLRAGAVWVDRPGPESVVVKMENVLHSSVDGRSGSARGTGTIALSPDGRWLVVAADGKNGTSLCDGRTGQLVKVLDDLSGGVQFSPDGRWLVLVTSTYCRVFRTANWEMAWSQPMDTQSRTYAGAAAFSPDGVWLAFARSSTRLSLVAAETGRELGELESPSPSPIRVARWSGDGRRLVLWTRENTLDVWQPAGLRRELAGLGLDWDVVVKPVNRGAPSASVTAGSSGKWTTSILLVATGLVGFVALGFLRRHRRLIGEYSKAEGLALRREEELKMERELSELKSRFVSMVSHEFRTPLGITMSAVELLRNHLDQLDHAKRQELFDDIFGSTQHMAGLMEQVLLLGRVEAGKLAYRPAPVDLPALCEKLVDESLSATNRRCPIQMNLDRAFPGASADESLLRHILTNLLSNAVKYSPAGVPVELGLRREGGRAVLTVRDRGIGIPEGDLPKLFQAFHRAANVGDIQGTGLGLVIVKRCVDLHGGTIEVQSQPGAGTTFTVRLPAVAPSS